MLATYNISGVSSKLGLSTSDEQAVLSGGRIVYFQHGAIFSPDDVYAFAISGDPTRIRTIIGLATSIHVPKYATAGGQRVLLVVVTHNPDNPNDSSGYGGIWNSGCPGPQICI